MRRWPVLIALALAVAGLSVFAFRQVGQDSEQPGERPTAEEAFGESAESSSPELAPLDGDTSGSADQTVPTSEGPQSDPVAPALPDVAGRKIVRNASISLEVADVGAMVQRVENIATAGGGFVANSSFFSEPQESTRPLPEDREQVLGQTPERSRTATLTIRVPSTQYVGTLSQLRELGTVITETSSTGDVTEEFADLEARQRNLEATEQQYLSLLERAQDIGEVLTVQDRINGVRLEIERIQGRLNLLNNLTDLATLEVVLGPPPPVLEPPDGQGWDPAAVANRAWDASQAVLAGFGDAAIIGGIVMAWLAIPATVGILVWRRLRLGRP